MKLEKEQKIELTKIIISVILFLGIFITDKIIHLETVFDGDLGFLFPFFLYLICYLIVGYKVVFKAFKNLFSGKMLDETFLMTLATFGAFGLAIYKGINNEQIEGFDEACMVMILYMIGEFFQDYAVERSKKSISGLLELKPMFAWKKEDGKIKKVALEEIKMGDILVVNPGEKIPVDGIITQGESQIDTRAITGESMPKEVSFNDKITSGCVNLTTQFEMEATKKYDDSTISKIIKLMEEGIDKKSKAENFISKFARIYTPIVVILAVIIMLIPSLITKDSGTWIYRGLSFLVVSCPCALVISVPLSFFVGLGKASKCGILIKNSTYLEQIEKANIFVFDKTGTLTKGNLVVKDIFPKENEEEILKSAYIAEKFSSHPIALSIKKYIEENIKIEENIDNFTLTNVSGFGVIAKSKVDTIYSGNEKLMKKANITFKKQEGTVVYVAKNEKYLGCIVLEDEVKQESKETISLLHAENCKTYMLTGDSEFVASQVATNLGVNEYKSCLLPQEKVEFVETLIKNKEKSDTVCFVGDGINDAPVLTRADVGVSMGGIGSDIAIEASDMVLMNDDLLGLINAKQIGKKTKSIVKQNVVFAILVKLAILILSVLGLTNMYLAIFGDVGVSILTILNATRISNTKLVKKDKKSKG